MKAKEYIEKYSQKAMDGLLKGNKELYNEAILGLIDDMFRKELPQIIEARKPKLAYLLFNIFKELHQKFLIIKKSTKIEINNKFVYAISEDVYWEVIKEFFGKFYVELYEYIKGEKPKNVD